MSKEITRKDVLCYCLENLRQEMKICSKDYKGLEPAQGMEEAWTERRQMVTILEEIIHSFDSEKVRAAVAGWQQEVMQHGPSALKLDREPEGADIRLALMADRLG